MTDSEFIGTIKEYAYFVITMNSDEASEPVSGVLTTKTVKLDDGAKYEYASTGAGKQLADNAFALFV